MERIVGKEGGGVKRRGLKGQESQAPPTSRSDPFGTCCAEFLPPHISAARTDMVLLIRRTVRPSGIPAAVVTGDHSALVSSGFPPQQVLVGCPTPPVKSAGGSPAPCSLHRYRGKRWARSGKLGPALFGNGGEASHPAPSSISALPFRFMVSRARRFGNVGAQTTFGMSRIISIFGSRSHML